MSRIIENAWRANPHPDLADTFAHLRSGDSARDRLARVQSLAQKAPGHREGALAVAQAALAAREFATARAALAPLAGAVTQRVALLFARLEELEHGDEGRAREWMTRAVRARRDPAWTADGFVSERWLPVSPVTGRLDAFHWMEPLAQLGAPSEVIEADDDLLAPPAPAAATVPPLAPETVSVAAASPPPDPLPPSALKGEAVIPLLHAPDDPGPDGEQQAEPASEAPPPARNLDWLRGLFK